MTAMTEIQGVHQEQPVRTAGQPIDRAQIAVVLVHGRGSTAEDILALARPGSYLDRAGFAYLAPQAAGNTWYPNSFLAALESNEPYLSSALATLDGVFARLQAVGIPPGRTILLGFSQGACLALEYAARRARRYGGIAGLSGGLIGPDGTPRSYTGSLEGTPVFLGCSDVDPHIPRARVELSADVLRQLGADVTLKLYPNMGHTISQDELDAVRAMMDALAG